MTTEELKTETDVEIKSEDLCSHYGEQSQNTADVLLLNHVEIVDVKTEFGFLPQNIQEEIDPLHNFTVKTKTTQSTIEKQRQQRRENERKRREKIRANPDLYQEAKEKDRQRYLKRKEDGRVKTISEVPAKQKRYIRRKWREAAAKHRNKLKKKDEFLKFLESETPPCSPQIEGPKTKAKTETTKSAIEKRRKQKRECQRRRREEIRANPDLYREAKEKERLRYLKRKEEGRVKTISEVSAKQRSYIRSKWRQAAAKHRRKLKQNDEVLKLVKTETPPCSPQIGRPNKRGEDNVALSKTKKQRDRRKEIKKESRTCCKELTETKRKLEEMEKQAEKYKVLYDKLKQKLAEGKNQKVT